MFQAVNGRLPGADGNEATFKSDLAAHVRQFPESPVGPAANANVLMASGGSPNGDANPSEGWKYYFDTGRFILNYQRKTEVDNSVFYDEL